MKKIIIVDDELPACQIIREYLGEHSHLKVVAECHNGLEGAKAIAEFRPDLLFLDIQMPKLNGFEMLEVIQENPAIIFTTAYDEYALKAFEANALDYLLKPFSQKRFDQALNKWQTQVQTTREQIRHIKETPHKQPDEHLRVVIREEARILIIPTREVQYIEAYGDYVKIHHNGKTHIKHKTMHYFEETLDPTLFIRIHRSYILNIEELTKIEPYQKNKYVAVLRSGDQIPISRSAYSSLKKILGF